MKHERTAVGLRMGGASREESNGEGKGDDTKLDDCGAGGNKSHRGLDAKMRGISVDSE